MKKIWTVLFVIYNIVSFVIGNCLFPLFPHRIFFGIIPTEYLIILLCIVFNALIWGLYFNKFLDTQKHVDERYAGK